MKTATKTPTDGTCDVLKHVGELITRLVQVKMVPGSRTDVDKGSVLLVHEASHV